MHEVLFSPVSTLHIHSLRAVVCRFPAPLLFTRGRFTWPRIRLSIGILLLARERDRADTTPERALVGRRWQHPCIDSRILHPFWLPATPASQHHQPVEHHLPYPALHHKPIQSHCYRRRPQLQCTYPPLRSQLARLCRRWERASTRRARRLARETLPVPSAY